MSIDANHRFMAEDFQAAPDEGALAGVLFAEDFDLGPPAAEPAADPPPISAEEVAMARALGHAEGRAAALLEAQAGAETAREAALAALVAALAEARAAATAAAAAGSASLARAMLQALATALPELCAHHGPAEVRALAASLMPRLVHQPLLSIRASPHTMPALRAVAALHAGAVDLIPTDALAEGDLAIAWQDGALVRDSTALLAELGRMLAPLGVTVRAGRPQATFAPAPVKELEDA